MQTFTLNLLDLLLLLPLAYASYHGYKKGFSVELVNTLGFLLGLAGAIIFLDSVVQFISPMVKGNLRYVLPVVGFMAIFLLIWVVARTLGKLASKIIRSTLFGTADRAIGAGIAAVKMLFVFGTMVWILGLVGVSLPEELITQSALYPVIDTLGPGTMRLASTFMPFLQEFVKTVELSLPKA